MADNMMGALALDKGRRFAKISGDFAERLVLYWLSKFGYECAYIDHVGIDLIACKELHDQSAFRVERRGISVKCRCWNDGTCDSVTIEAGDIQKADETCRIFGLNPYFAIVVETKRKHDTRRKIRCFVVPLRHLVKVAGGERDGNRQWKMSGKALKEYREDRQIGLPHDWWARREDQLRLASNASGLR